jgi:hypothetical protein
LNETLQHSLGVRVVDLKRRPARAHVSFGDQGSGECRFVKDLCARIAIIQASVLEAFHLDPKPTDDDAPTVRRCGP